MAKKYGRNQKQRHRDRIANLEENVDRLKSAYEMQTRLVEHLGRKLSETEEKALKIVKIVESVCSNSVALPPVEIEGYYECDRIDLDIPSSQVPFNRDSLICGSLKSVRLYKLQVLVETNLEQMTNAVHAHYRYGKHVSYMISDIALRNIPACAIRDRLIPMIGEELAMVIKRW